MDPQTSPTLAERAAGLAEAAANAPAFGGIRQHLNDAADFASAVAAEIEFLKQQHAGTVSACNDAVGLLRDRLSVIEGMADGLKSSIDANDGTEAELVAQVADLTARLEALEAAKG